MRTFELRVYTLSSQVALDYYRDEIYPRHLSSFPIFGIEAHGFWTAPSVDAHPRLFALVSYNAGDDPREVGRQYMQSNEFADDIKNFDASQILGVESTILTPSESSPLK